MAMDINGLNTGQTNANRTKSGQTVVAPKNAAPVDAAATTGKPASDTVQISSQAQTLNRIQAQVGKEAPVNREKVEALKTAIAEGRYKPDAQAIAKQMIDNEQLF